MIDFLTRWLCIDIHAPFKDRVTQYLRVLLAVTLLLYVTGFGR